jgi:integrase/recombinase XerD
MITYVPYYREQRKTIVIRIFINGEIAKVVNTGIKIEPSQWDAEGRKVKGHPNKTLFNQKIINKVADLQKEIIKAEVMDVALTRSRVKRLAEGGKVTTDFYEHCLQWIQEKYTNTGTKKSALSDLNKVHSYAPSLQFGDIDRRWLMGYERHVREVLKNKGNTPWKAMKFVRTMLYDAQDVLGKHLPNPFEDGSYKMPDYIDPDKDGLYVEELDRIEKLLLEPHPVVLKIMAAKFLFMCYTGLRISDAKRFSSEHLKNGERIVITSKKTGVTTNLKLYNRLGNILERLNQLPQKSVADQNFNDYLKVIAGLAGITRLTFSSHLGRHTFGCLCAEMRLSVEEAQKLMGHKNKRATLVYYRLRQPQMDRAAELLNGF